MKATLCVVIALVVVATTIVDASKQRYIVTGRFMCGRQPSKGSDTSVKLLDKNTGRDTTMGKQKVDSNGGFRIDGTSSGLTKITPELHIYTDCNDGKPCQRRWKLDLPQRYIDDAGGYDIGTINLETKLVKGEDRDCWH